MSFEESLNMFLKSERVEVGGTGKLCNLLIPRIRVAIVGDLGA
jgi:hypothetical protein